MALLSTNCPHCGEGGRIHKAYSGKSVSCPSCHRDFVVGESGRNASVPVASQLQGSASTDKSDGFPSSARPMTHTLIHCMACGELSWAEGCVSGSAICSVCGREMQTVLASPSKPAILVHRHNGAIQPVDSYADIADALLAGDLSPDETFCAVAPPAQSPAGQASEGDCVAKARPNWKPIKKARTFPIKVLFNPVMAYADAGVTAGFIGGAILSLLVFAAGFLSAAGLPVFDRTASLGFGSRLILLLVPMLLLPLFRSAGAVGVFAVWLANTLVALAVLKGAGLNVTFYDANTFLMGLWLALVVTTALSGLALALPGGIVGMIVGVVRQPQLPKLSG